MSRSQKEAKKRCRVSSRGPEESSIKRDEMQAIDDCNEIATVILASTKPRSDKVAAPEANSCLDSTIDGLRVLKKEKKPAEPETEVAGGALYYQKSALSEAKSLFKKARRAEKRITRQKKRKRNGLPEESIQQEFRKKSCKSLSPPRIELQSEEEVAAVVALLRNEVQSPYVPAGEDVLSLSGAASENFEANPTGPATAERKQKSGPFTREEHQRLKESVESYFKAKAWSPDTGWEQLFALNSGGCRISKRRAAEQSGHWAIIRNCLPLRAVSSIQRHALRRLYPWKRGAWTLAEAEKLVCLVEKFGPQWTLLSSEYFKRAPNYLHLKYKELEPLVLQRKPLRRRRSSLSWTKEDDVELLANIKLATGVPLPHRAIPWSAIQQRMPRYSTYQLMARYRERLFPLIIRGQGGAMSAKVRFRQYIRYLHNGIRAGIIKDASEVEVKRVVPFWFGAAFAGKFSTYLRSRCPTKIREAPFQEQVRFIYQQSGCDKMERHDLASLASALEVLRRMNGAEAAPPTGDSTSSSKSSDAQLSDFARTLFTQVEGSDDASSSELRVGLPLSVSTESAAAVMPPGAAQTMPEMYPFYLSQAARRNAGHVARPVGDLSAEADTETEGVSDPLATFLQRRRTSVQKRAYRINGKILPVAKHPWLLTMDQSTSVAPKPPDCPPELPEPTSEDSIIA